MFNEIMLSVSEFLGNEKNTFSPIEDKSCMVKYISLGYDIPADSVNKIKTIKLPSPMYDIVLVDISEKNARINDFALYGGKVVKILSCNVNEIVTCQNDFIRVALIIAIFGDIINSIIEMNMHLINANIAASISFSNHLFYAPLLMTISYVQTYYPFITDDILYEVVGSMYTTATMDTISSARKLVTEFTIKSLLDECIWYGVNNKEYPDIRCNEIAKHNDDDGWEEQTEWDEDPFEGDEPNENED